MCILAKNIKARKAELDMEYWVLKQNLNQAKVQFKDAKRMMEAFEHWFALYPLRRQL